MSDELILRRIRVLSNAELLEMALEAAERTGSTLMPDDERPYEAELRRRLADWLKEER